MIPLLCFLLFICYLGTGVKIAENFVGKKISLVSTPRKAIFLFLWPFTVIGGFVGLLIYTPETNSKEPLAESAKESLLDLVRLSATVIEISHPSVSKEELERAGYSFIDFPKIIDLLRVWTLVLGYCDIFVKEGKANLVDDAVGSLAETREERK